MVLQSLCDYYQILLERGEAARPYWSFARVPLALEIGEDGIPLSLDNICEEVLKGKKTVLVPQTLEVPERGIRGSNFLPYFLCDKSEYLLGYSELSRCEAAEQRFQTSAALHGRILSDVDSPAARAARLFFETWIPEKAEKYAFFSEHQDELFSGANIALRFRGRFLYEYPEIAAAWETYRSGILPERTGQSLICGKTVPAARVHPKIYKFPDASPTGTSMVSFGGPAAESYGNEQGYNALIGEREAFAYAEALNYLIGNRKGMWNFNGFTLFCWPQSGEEVYQRLLLEELTNGNPEPEFLETVRAIAKGNPAGYHGDLFDPEMPIHILVCTPNAGRIAVRFFLREKLWVLMKNLEGHYRRLSAVKPSYIKEERLAVTIWFSKLADQKLKTKMLHPPFGCALLRAVLRNEPYPALLEQWVRWKIAGEHDVDYVSAATLKAVFLKNHPEKAREFDRLGLLCERTGAQPYLCGRLLALHARADPGFPLEKYLPLAAAKPKQAITELDRTREFVLDPMHYRLRNYYKGRMKEIRERMGHPPEQFSFYQQEIFYLGFYHQIQKQFEKKEEELEEDDNSEQV